MAKEVLGFIKLQIPAGGANPSPPVGPALGQRGLNIMDFCKAFNDKTKELEKGAPIPVVITAYKDRSFDFVTKLPPVSYYLKKAAKIKKGNSTPGRSLVGKVTISDIEKIAKEKMQDLNAIDLKGAVNMVKGSAVSMRMARQEGWTKNQKYSSMPELMLRNRAATFFGRQYIPDLLLGVQTSEEVVDIESEPINVSESSVRIEPQQEDENDIGF